MSGESAPMHAATTVMTMIHDADRETGRWTLGIDHARGRTELSCRLPASGGLVRIVVDALPDLDLARRWLGAVRRVDRIDLVVGADDVKARVHGCRHRLPFATDVPLRVGLGLAQLGHRTRILGRAARW